MIGLLKKLFGAKPAEQTAEAPYKAEAVSAPVVETAPMPVGIEAVVATPTVVVAEAVVEQAPAKKPAPKKTQSAPKPKSLHLKRHSLLQSLQSQKHHLSQKLSQLLKTLFVECKAR